MIVRTVLTFICALLILPGFATAQEDNPYIVKDVTVDIVDQSAVAARNKAFSEGQVKAFKLLAARFIDAEQLAAFKSPDPNTIAGMVADFEIANEQLSKKRYIGTYTFRFKESAVYRYFGHGPLDGYAGIARTDLLLLPVFINNGKPVLWDVAKNPWLKLWQQDKAANVVIPLGDTSDMIDAKEGEMPILTRVGLRRLKARYGVQDAVVATAVFNAAARPPLKIDLYRTDLQETKLAQTIPIEVAGEKKLGELMAKALLRTKESLATNWKLGQEQEVVQTAVAAAPDMFPAESAGAAPQSATTSTARASVRFSTMGEWLAIRRSLNGIPGLNGVRITSLATNQADLELVYANWSIMTGGLASKGLALVPAGSGYLLTRSTSGYVR